MGTIVRMALEVQLFAAAKDVWFGSLTLTCRTCNPEVTQRRRFDSALGHCWVTTIVVHTHLPLSPSSIIWYRLHHWDVNRHTARYTGPVSVVSQWAVRLGKDFTFFEDVYTTAC